MALPFMLPLRLLGEPALYWLRDALPASPLLSFEVTCWGSVFVGLSALTLGLRLQLARVREPAWGGAPVVVGQAPRGWRQRLLRS